MTPGQIKRWKKECTRYEKEFGYVPAELQMLPMILGLVDKGLLEMGSNDEFDLIIKTKENSNEQL